MKVEVSSHDQATAAKVRAGLLPLCTALEKQTDQDLCRLAVAPGVVVAEFYAKDGARAKVPVGVKPLALVVAQNDPAQLGRYVAQMIAWAKRQQLTDRLTRGIGMSLALS